MKRVVTITSGVGPEEVRWFVRLLSARIAALCHDMGFRIIQSVCFGNEDAPRSVRFELNRDIGDLLAAEIGTHALIARSQRRGRHGRKRWFARVLLSDADTGPSALAVVDEREVQVSACRAAGPGGQHVNKTNSAIRVWHPKTGISIKVAEERSQQQNRAIALRRLAQEINRRQEAKMTTDKSNKRREHYRLERGNAVRQYRIGRDGKLEQHQWKRATLTP